MWCQISIHSLLIFPYYHFYDVDNIFIFITPKLSLFSFSAVFTLLCIYEEVEMFIGYEKQVFVQNFFCCKYVIEMYIVCTMLVCEICNIAYFVYCTSIRKIKPNVLILLHAFVKTVFSSLSQCFSEIFIFLSMTVQWSYNYIHKLDISSRG